MVVSIQIINKMPSLCKFFFTIGRIFFIHCIGNVSLLKKKLIKQNKKTNLPYSKLGTNYTAYKHYKTIALLAG